MELTKNSMNRSVYMNRSKIWTVNKDDNYSNGFKMAKFIEECAVII
jgi:hypothetical protein